MLEPRDHLEIIALYAEYNRSVDAGDANAWSATFTRDGAFRHPSVAFVGQDELRRFVRERTERLVTDPVGEQRHWNDAIILSQTGSEAKGGCRVLISGVEKTGGRPVVVARGSYDDLLVRELGKWRFAERKLTVV